MADGTTMCFPQMLTRWWLAINLLTYITLHFTLTERRYLWNSRVTSFSTVWMPFITVYLLLSPINKGSCVIIQGAVKIWINIQISRQNSGHNSLRNLSYTYTHMQTLQEMVPKRLKWSVFIIYYNIFSLRRISLSSLCLWVFELCYPC